MELSCIAIDDEPLALEIIKSHVEKIENLELKASFTKPMQGLAYIQERDVDLVLLDINMPDLDGIQLAKLINKKSQIVFTTAYSEYATEGFELAVTDYLLKPIRFERFLKMVNRVRENRKNNTEEKQNSLFVKDGSKWQKVDLNDLLFIQANDNYVVFQEPEKKVMARMTLSQAKDLLNTENFIQVHRSFIINFPKIDKLQKHQVEILDHSIPVSRKYYESLFSRIQTG